MRPVCDNAGIRTLLVTTSDTAGGNAQKPQPRLVKGFRDVFAADLSRKQKLIDTVRGVYERYGYMPLETPSVEFVDVLGKFLPESVTPAGGIFAFRNPDLGKGVAVGVGGAGGADEWMSLRYDLTAPLARVAAQYAQDLPKPYRRYQVGSVFRYEKPGPGRFREFTQFDFDAVGVSSMAADAEACCVMCDAMEALGFAAGDYAVRVNTRKVMQGVLESCGVGGSAGAMGDPRALVVLRAIDKLDRLGERGVAALLGKGREDESGDYTAGAELTQAQIDVVLGYLRSGSGGAKSRAATIDELARLVGATPSGAAGVEELQKIDEYLTALGYEADRITIDPTIIRGLAYYTGPVFEGVIIKPVTGEDGQPRQFGSVYGGGRYDDLVERFTGAKVPATGASIGVDRMLEAMKLLTPARAAATAQVLIVVVEKERMAWYLKLGQTLRRAGLRCEVYVGDGGMKQQFKYADRLGVRFAVVAGGNELSRGVVQVKDMAAGKAAADTIASREEWRKAEVSQREVNEAALADELLRLVGQAAR